MDILKAFADIDLTNTNMIVSLILATLCIFFVLFGLSYFSWPITLMLFGGLLGITSGVFWIRGTEDSSNDS